ncbi:MAG: hypothetical protein H6625_00640 [Bdellovibrionaceae bacterium]|nr:hypothetical protein [Pseudobdellovibrionaceae bacterium]
MNILALNFLDHGAKIMRIIVFFLIFFNFTGKAFAWKPGQSFGKLIKDTAKDIDKGPLGDVGRGVEHLGKEVTGVNSDNRTKEARKAKASAEAKNKLLIEKSTLDTEVSNIDKEIRTLNISIAEKKEQKKQLLQNNKDIEKIIKNDTTLNILETIFESFEKVKNIVRFYISENDEELKDLPPLEMWKRLIDSYGEDVKEQFPESDETVSTIKKTFEQLKILEASQAQLVDDINGLIMSPDFIELRTNFMNLNISLMDIQLKQSAKVELLTDLIDDLTKKLTDKKASKEKLVNQLKTINKSLGIK